MAKATQIKALLESALKGDKERLYALAMQIAAAEATKGHGKLAEEIKKMIDEAKSQKPFVISGGGAVPLVRPKGELATLLDAYYPDKKLNDMVLNDDVRTSLTRVLKEQRQRDTILAYNLSPRAKLLLIGPPGCGKTMTAAALAGELHLPLFTIRLENVITRYMGETATKLRLIFDAIPETRGVYLFDEFDAIGSKRTASNDVGEIRRVLNSFLQFLEKDPKASLVIAATNHPELLDYALLRRFDDIIKYNLPDVESAKQILQSRLVLLDSAEVDWNKLAESAIGLSQADLVRIAQNVFKSSILMDKKTITTNELLSAINEQQQNRGNKVAKTSKS